MYINARTHTQVPPCVRILAHCASSSSSRPHMCYVCVYKPRSCCRRRHIEKISSRCKMCVAYELCLCTIDVLCLLNAQNTTTKTHIVKTSRAFILCCLCFAAFISSIWNVRLDRYINSWEKRSNVVLIVKCACWLVPNRFFVHDIIYMISCWRLNVWVYCNSNCYICILLNK